MEITKETEQIVANLTELLQEPPRIEGYWYRWDRVDYMYLKQYYIYKAGSWTGLYRTREACRLFIL